MFDIALILRKDRDLKIRFLQDRHFILEATVRGTFLRFNVKFVNFVNVIGKG